MLKLMKIALLAAMTVAAVLLFTGCSSKSLSIDEMLSLPQLPDEYIDLQRKINQVLASGAVYAAPASGSHRQSVQLYDINGDGINEALAFFKVYEDKPLKLYIFYKTDKGYSTATTIDGDGTDIESINYIDMNGDGWSEIVVGWQMESGIQMLNVYSLKGYIATNIATSDYTEYTTTDMDDDGDQELLVLRHDSTSKVGELEMFYINADGETESMLAKLSLGMDYISKLTTGKLRDLHTALFVEGSFKGNGLITDIFTYENNKLSNITLTGSSAVSEGTIRSVTVYCRDIDNDGIMEIPISRALYTKSETVYKVLDWYSFNQKGRRTLKLSTYHNYSDGWYLVLPEKWGTNITIRREDSVPGERAVIFSIWNGSEEPVTDFLIIYSITGENRKDIASKDGRVIIFESQEVIYAAELILSQDKWSLAPDITYLKDNFSLIYSEWITGLIYR
jgi:hypothetical protein